jgi:hypothetical protein
LSATQPANSKSARKKKKQPKTPNVLLSVHLRIARPVEVIVCQSFTAAAASALIFIRLEVAPTN